MNSILLKTSKLITIILFVSMLSGCSLLASLLEGNNVIIFGTGTFDDGISQEKRIFKQDEDFLFEAQTSSNFKTTTIHFTLIKDDFGSETIYDDWEVSVDPTWNSLLYEFHLVDEDGEFEPGDYIVRMFKEDFEYVTEATFTIIE